MKKELSFNEINEIAIHLREYIEKENITVIGLIGDLGTGKTHFVKQFIKSYNILDNVKSPTFNYVNTYENKNIINHFDVYRLDNETIEEIGFYDYLENGISIIEWANKIQDVLDDNTLYIELEYSSDTTRYFSAYRLKKGVKEYVNLFNNYIN